MTAAAISSVSVLLVMILVVDAILTAVVVLSKVAVNFVVPQVLAAGRHLHLIRPQAAK